MPFEMLYSPDTTRLDITTTCASGSITMNPVVGYRADILIYGHTWEVSMLTGTAAWADAKMCACGVDFTRNWAGSYSGRTLYNAQREMTLTMKDVVTPLSGNLLVSDNRRRTYLMDADDYVYIFNGTPLNIGGTLEYIVEKYKFNVALRNDYLRIEPGVVFTDVDTAVGVCQTEAGVVYAFWIMSESYPTGFARIGKFDFNEGTREVVAQWSKYVLNIDEYEQYDYGVSCRVVPWGGNNYIVATCLYQAYDHIEERWYYEMAIAVYDENADSLIIQDHYPFTSPGRGTYATGVDVDINYICIHNNKLVFGPEVTQTYPDTRPYQAPFFIVDVEAATVTTIFHDSEDNSASFIGTAPHVIDHNTGKSYAYVWAGGTNGNSAIVEIDLNTNTLSTIKGGDTFQYATEEHMLQGDNGAYYLDIDGGDTDFRIRTLPEWDIALARDPGIVYLWPQYISVLDDADDERIWVQQDVNPWAFRGMSLTGEDDRVMFVTDPPGRFVRLYMFNNKVIGDNGNIGGIYFLE